MRHTRAAPGRLRACARLVRDDYAARRRYRGKASDFIHSLSPIRSRHVSALRHCSVWRIAEWNGINVFSPSGKSLGAFLHLLLFSGFVVLTIGTTLLAIAYDGPYYFHHGW